MPDNPFVGTWRLVSYIYEYENGDVTYPYGKDASGYITYGADGYMSVALMSSNRPKFDSNRARPGKLEDKAAAFDGYISYAGPYTVREETVTHHVEIAWFPNVVGLDNVRGYRLNGNRIILTVPPVTTNGSAMTEHLTWEKV